MTPETIQILWLLGCLAAIGFAFGFPADERRNAVLLAVAIQFNWAFVQSTYTLYGVQFLFGHFGLHWEARTFWAFADFLVGLCCVCKDRKTWLDWTILGAIIVQLVSHDLRNYATLDSEAYLHQIDVMLAVILLAFVFGGAKGVSDAVRWGIDHYRGGQFRSRTLAALTYERQR